jgi:hypothetical protein
VAGCGGESSPSFVTIARALPTLTSATGGRSRRALRRRGARPLPAAVLRMLASRTSLALARGLATMGAVALLGYEYSVRTGLAFAGAAAGGGALLLASASVLSAVRVHGTAPGGSCDVFADLAGLVPERLCRDPWELARAVALLVGVGVWVAGIAAADPLDELLRGVLEALACPGGFAVLGRFLGLRR